MGIYSGKLLTLYICQSGVRVVEGENKNGNPNISRFFTVPATDEYFSEVPGASTYEITNMSGLVQAILEECANQRTSAKRVMIASDCLNITTTIMTGSGKSSIKDLFTSDLGAKKSKSGPAKGSPGNLVCNLAWGDLIQDGKSTKQLTSTSGDKFMLKSLVQEFYHRGYQVISVSDTSGILMNLKQTEEATFDHKGKVIFSFDSNITAINFVKDLPVAINRYASMSAFELSERIVALVQDAVEITGRSPRIFLTGSMMSDTVLYAQLIDRLEAVGFSVYDLFDRPEVDPETGKEPGTGRPVLTPDYAANISMLMSAYAKNVIALHPKIELSDMFKQNSKALATVAMIMSIAFFGVGVFSAVTTLISMKKMEANPPMIDSLQSNISSLQQQQTQLNNTITTLTQADVTVLDTINFVYSNQSPLINIVSIDTRDMLNGTEVDDSGTLTAAAAPGDESTETEAGDTTAEGDTTGEGDTSVEGGETSSTGVAREPIVVRGYARTPEAALDFHDRLFNYGLKVDPIFNGVEKYELPDKSLAYIFEIEIGG